jgi:hypothetical protein
MTPPLEINNLAKNTLHYEKISSSSHGKEKHARTHAHIYTRGYTDKDNL